MRQGRTSAAAAGLPIWKLRRTAVLRSRATRGDTAAFAELYERHHQALYRYCRSIVHHDDDAHDALQNTMAKAFAALQYEERDFDLRPWLFRIAHNEAISLLRRRRGEVTLDFAETIVSDSLPAALEDRERLAQLMADLGDLPERQRAALVLRELNGLGHDEIAAVLDSSPRAIKQTIFEARTGLHECAEGREMACADVQRTLSDGDGRVLRGRKVRAHLRDCQSCRQFKAALAQRPADLALLAPPLPAAASAALLLHLLPGAKASAVAGGSSAAAAGGAALTTKVAIIVAATATTAGGTVAGTEIEHHRSQQASSQAERAPLPAAGATQPVSLSVPSTPSAIARTGGTRPGGRTQGGSKRHKSSASPRHAGGRNSAAKPEPAAGTSGHSGKVPPGHAEKAVEPAKKTPPGKAMTPPGQSKTPPVKTKTPPVKTKTPPGHAKTPPGQTKTPPGQTKKDLAPAEKTPPGQAKTPRGQAKAPTGQTTTPPGQSKPPPGQSKPPKDQPAATPTPVPTPAAGNGNGNGNGKNR